MERERKEQKRKKKQTYHQNPTGPDSSQMRTGQETEGKLRQGKIQLHTKKEFFLVKEVKHCKGCPEITAF